MSTLEICILVFVSALSLSIVILVSAACKMATTKATKEAMIEVAKTERSGTEMRLRGNPNN